MVFQNPVIACSVGECALIGTVSIVGFGLALCGLGWVGARVIGWLTRPGRAPRAE